MRHNKIVSAAIALCVTAAFTMTSVPSASAATPTPVTITGTFDFSTFPDVTGTFTTTGALTISGPAFMHVNFLDANQSTVAHCVVALFAPLGNIIIHQQCQFATSMPAPYPNGQGKGRWQIVSGTGAYANLSGNGSLTMPANEEAMTGVIFQ